MGDSEREKGPGIPAPSGQYRVGCVDLMHQLAGDEKGGLLVRLTYPTEATPGAGYPYSSWFPHHRYTRALLEFAIKTSAPSKDIMLTMASENPQIPALEGAPLYQTNAPVFPVIVFSHGLAGIRTFHSAIVCDLASHGYVVAAVEHRDESASVTLLKVPKAGGGVEKDELEGHWLEHYHLGKGEKEFYIRNRQVKQRAIDVRGSLDVLTLLNEGAEIRNMMEGSYDFRQFKGRLDTSRAGLMGHSFGGATTVQTLTMDNRFKCGLALDASMVPLHRDLYQQGVAQPLYFINSYYFQWVKNVQRMMMLTKPLRGDGITGARVLTLNGTHHFNQCDLPFLSPIGSTLNCEKAHQVNMDICLAFLARHLLKDPAYQGPIPNLDGTEGHSEHIIFGTNLDLDKSKTQSHL